MFSTKPPMLDSYIKVVNKKRHLHFQKTGSDYEFGYHAQSELGLNGVGSRGSHGHLETKVNGETVRFPIILKCYAIECI